MFEKRAQEALGILLVFVGVVFFLVNNRLVWFGWAELWPVLPLIIGLFLVRVYFTRRKPRQLFWGTLFSLLGFFFLIFSTHILPWSRMGILWPTFPLILGASLLVISGVIDRGTSALVVGLGAVVIAMLGYMATGGVIQERVIIPLVRVWPLVLVGAGILVFLRARRERAGPIHNPPAPSTETRGPESQN